MVHQKIKLSTTNFIGSQIFKEGLTSIKSSLSLMNYEKIT